MSDSDATDASEDADGDFLTNLGEYLSGTSPADSDSDNDGLTDVYDLGLESYWRFGETAGSPASAANSVSGGPSLTLNGATIVTGGLFGNALKPTYYTNNVQAAAVVLDDAEEWSFSGWFKVDSYSTTNVLFAARTGSSGDNVIGASLSGVGWGAMTLNVTLDNTNYTAAINVPQNSGYHHLAVSRDQQRNRADVYYDGTLLASVPPTSSPEPLALASGQFKVSTVPNATYNDWLNGSMDDVRLYRRKLAATEIDALYEHGTGSSNASKYWTLQYLLNNPAGQADADSDGFTNLAEIIAGSDAQDGLSTPVTASGTYQLHTKLKL